MNKNMILAPFKNIDPSNHFSEYDHCAFSCQINHYTELLQNGYDIACGVTKLVVIPEGFDFVVKIPFKCQAHRDNKCWHRTDTLHSFLRDYGNCIVFDDEEDPEDGYFIVNDPLNGAYDYVTETDYEYDYCGVEEQLYKEAEAEGLAPLFAKTEFVHRINGYDIYIQEKCEETYGDSGRTYSDKDKESGKTVEELEDDHYYSEFALCWLIDVYNTYGEEMLIKLLHFEESWLSDIHYGNYGYRNGKPIILDYSGFNS